MAVLNSNELAKLRQAMAAGQAEVDWDKSIVNGALQAVEDFFETNRLAISTAIDAGTAPYVFQSAQKKRLVAFWFRQKFGREGVV